MELAELSAVGLTFLLKLLVIWARHHFHQVQGTNYCRDIDGCGFMFGCMPSGVGTSKGEPGWARGSASSPGGGPEGSSISAVGL